MSEIKHHNHGNPKRIIHHIEVVQGHEPPVTIYKKVIGNDCNWAKNNIIWHF